MRVNFLGDLPTDVTAKDMVLHVIAQVGHGGGSGYAVEFAGAAIRQMEIEQRMSLCNMAVEFSAFTGLVAPDQKTQKYTKTKRMSP